MPEIQSHPGPQLGKFPTCQEHLAGLSFPVLKEHLVIWSDINLLTHPPPPTLPSLGWPAAHGTALVGLELVAVLLSWVLASVLKSVREEEREVVLMTLSFMSALADKLLAWWFMLPPAGSY